MKILLVTGPSIEPVTYEEVETHLRLDVDSSTADSVLIDETVTSARVYVESITRRALMTQTWEYCLDEWPDKNFITIPFGNLQSVESVKHQDTAGSETTLTVATDYLVETNGEGHGRVVLPYATSWPSGTLYPSNPITIRFICGWVSRDVVPGNIKAAIKMICADLYSNRESQVFGQSGQAFIENKTVNSLLSSHRLWGDF